MDRKPERQKKCLKPQLSPVWRKCKVQNHIRHKILNIAILLVSQFHPPIHLRAMHVTTAN